MFHVVLVSYTRTRTRTNTNPNGTKASATGILRTASTYMHYHQQPPRLLGVTKRMHGGLLVPFETGGGKAEVPNTAGVKQGGKMALLPRYKKFVMQPASIRWATRYWWESSSSGRTRAR